MAGTPSSFDSKAFLKTLTALPGVYRMLDERGEILYVGKARNLRQRVTSYFRENHGSAKTASLVAHIRAIEVTVTHTETEALLLESILIKEHQPRYNILLRDDKGYPYIHVSAGDFPRLSLHRGAKRAPGRYFGPYPNATAVRDTLHLLQKIFRLRSCEDSFFQGRRRPCLQYQIKRCTAPCVGLIDRDGYHQQLQDAVLFLEGKSGQLVNGLVRRMEAAAGALNFEEAAAYRDQIVELREIQHHQHIEGESGDLDVIACVTRGGVACVQVFVFRDGRLLGNRAFFPQLPQEEGTAAVQAAFLAQYYLEKDVPAEILITPEPLDGPLLAQAFSERLGRRVTLSSRVRGGRAHWLEMARRNAELALAAHLASRAGVRHRLEALRDALGLETELARLECFDISHTQGEATVAACVVFDGEGPLKSAYRRYNIEGITPGDDYAALHQALARRYERAREEGARLPDIVFIDGGKGQLAQAGDVLQQLRRAGVIVIGVAKGAGRKPGLETLYLFDKDRPIILPVDSAALHLVQQIRDEAHRFAITGHRRRRAKARTTSALDGILGIGPKRRQALLKQFGGLKQLSRAGIEDIAQVDGVNAELAQRIYDAFHGEG
ncbi:MAG: excinuclease ABC subunit UvrC [Candidatus Competibacter sp.]|nr:excinuclease ABC subunit UvrC [Candidatus Competibacteraceae bacterium]MBK8965019.1 excinuclease ABC subunit UvrC [Candidatus Competibacteraceae bacterium]